MNIDYRGAKARIEAASGDAVVNPQLSPWEINEARHEAAKRYCIEIGAEVLTAPACKYLFDVSRASTVRGRRLAEPDEAVAFSLNFSLSVSRATHLLRLSWAKTQWKEPKDYAERLAKVRASGHVLGLDGKSILILSPVDLLTVKGESEFFAAYDGADAGVATTGTAFTNTRHAGTRQRER